VVHTLRKPGGENTGSGGEDKATDCGGNGNCNCNYNSKQHYHRELL